MAVGPDEGHARVDQPLLNGDVRADPRVDVVDLDALLARELAADLLVPGVGDVARWHDEVEGEEGLLRIGDGRVAVVLAVVLDHVRPGEVPCRAHVQLQPDNVARLNGDVAGAMRGT